MPLKNEYAPQSKPHPGETLGEKLEELGMGPKEFAIRTCKPEKTIIAVLKGKSSITADMAIQFEHVTKNPANFWLNSQRNFDEYVARAKFTMVVAAATPWAAKFPVAEMVKLGWLPPVSKLEDQAAALLDYFGFAGPTAWEEYYLQQQLKVAFGISLAHIADPYSVSAWLRRGDLQGMALRAGRYSEQAFRRALQEIQTLKTTNRVTDLATIQNICLHAGVKVICTPGLQRVSINGVARWVGGLPLLQIANADTGNPAFWHTFYHEAGHIILHGKKEVFLEDLQYAEKDEAKEAEADRFAADWMGGYLPQS